MKKFSSKQKKTSNVYLILTFYFEIKIIYILTKKHFKFFREVPQYEENQTTYFFCLIITLICNVKNIKTEILLLALFTTL